VIAGQAAACCRKGPSLGVVIDLGRALRKEADRLLLAPRSGITTDIRPARGSVLVPWREGAYDGPRWTSA
jgi:hypothetical protein